MVHLATAEDRIREVWATNLEDEFKEICKVANMGLISTSKAYCI